MLKELHEKFVFVPTDKANNNISIVCKKFYVETSLRELGIFQEKIKGGNNEKNISNTTYVPITKSVEYIICRHTKYSLNKFSTLKIPESLPFLYWIPKMHKKPYSKQRFIAASGHCTTKPISAILTKCLRLVEYQLRRMCHYYENNFGINPMWILKNSIDVQKVIAPFNRRKSCKNIKTYDFSTLYTSIPHKLLKTKISWAITKAFQSSKYLYISIYKTRAVWTNFPKPKTQHVDCKGLTNLVRWLIDNIFVILGDRCFQQKIGIPMGTDCAPFLANLFLFTCEFQWIDKQRKAKRYNLLKKFMGCGRYIDDLFMINNDQVMDTHMSAIYPEELKLIPDKSAGNEVSFLDLNLIFKDSKIYTYIYDKRDSFSFQIVNFPVLSGNIPKSSSYGVFIGELVRYARGCTYFSHFRERTLLLIAKLKTQFFTLKRLKKTWVKFCNSHILLIQKYGSRIIEFNKEWK